MKKFEIEKTVSFLTNFIQNETFSNSKSSVVESNSRASKSISQPGSLRNSLVRAEFIRRLLDCKHLFAWAFHGEFVKARVTMIFIPLLNLQILKLLCAAANLFWIAIIRLKLDQNNFQSKSNLYLLMNTIEIVWYQGSKFLQKSSILKCPGNGLILKVRAKMEGPCKS